MSKNFMDAYAGMKTCKHIATENNPHGAASANSRPVAWDSSQHPRDAKVNEDFATTVGQETNMDSTLSSPRMCIKMKLKENFRGKTAKAITHFAKIAQGNYGLKITEAKRDDKVTMVLVVEGDEQNIKAFKSSLQKQTALRDVIIQ